MTKIKLADGTILIVSDIKMVSGVLNITTSDKTVEELAAIFSNTSKTNLITLLTENEIETGYKTGFTSFAGINYDADGTKTIELFQPIDASELRISSAEGVANSSLMKASEVEDQNAILASTVDSILTELIPNLGVTE